MRPYFWCRHCKKHLTPLVHRFGHSQWGRERMCPKCGKIWRLDSLSHQGLIVFGVIAGVGFGVVTRGWFPAPEGDILLLVLWLPLYFFVIWPALFALLGNFRMK
jgi:hypothetical protein